MEHIFKDNRVELFFGVLILFLSFAGVLGYIPREFILNVYLLVIFFLGIMLGSMLILYALQDYFKGAPAQRNIRRTRPRRRRR
ncbi:MAG: hypothetical protein ABIB47_04925 [Candidatus Woesearchaeota archaeon]